MKLRIRLLTPLLVVLAMLFFFGGFVRSAQSMTSDEERKLGKRVLEEVMRNLEVVRDLTLQSFINRVGRPLVNQIGPTPFEFDFYVIKANDPNAFAIPGGHIFVTTGLITLAESEPEIAGVLGHEIAHVTGRHIAQMIERSKRLSIATLAAMIAGAIAGRGGAASQAAVTTAMASAESLMLKYTRENETDADQNGLHYLSKAGYDPQAMVSFLKKMERYSLTAAPRIPQYLSTHPALDSRVSLLENLLSLQSKPAAPFQGKGNYKRIQTRAFVEERDPSAALSQFESLLKADPEDSDARFGLGLAFQRAGRLDKSVEILQSASRDNPNDPDLLGELGIAYFLAGRLDQAVETLGPLSGNDDLKPLYFLGRAYQEKGAFEQALALLLKVKREVINYPDLYSSLGSVYGRMGRQGLSHFFYGKYFDLKGDRNNALLHYRKALDFLEKGSSERAEAQQIVQELNPKSKQ